MFRCNNCGGNLVFDIRGQRLHCLYCDSHYRVDTYREQGADERTDLSDDEYEVTVYTCTQCGAEITSADNAAVGFCTYCGTEALLESRVAREKRPAKIIPFTRTKESVAESYGELVKKQPYVPKEFQDPAFIERFRGIYIPYWEYKVGFTGNPHVEVHENYSKGNYSYHREYEGDAMLSGTEYSLYGDASRSFDDEIAHQIAPYKQKGMRDFAPGYLAGFFADTADVDPQVYEAESLHRGEEKAVKGILRNYRKDSATVKNLPSREEKRTELFGTRSGGFSAAMFPVWFLTWRRGKRVAYGVVNGQTGEVCADIPIDTKKFFLISLAISAVCFLLMELLNVLILPGTMLSYSLLALLLTQTFFLKEVKAIRAREKHEYDAGFFEREKAEKVLAKNRGRLGGGCLTALLWTLALFALVLVWMMDDPREGAFVMAVFTFAVGVLYFIRSLIVCFGLKEKQMLLGSLLPFAAQAAAVLLTAGAPPEDWVYYGCAIGALGAAFVTALLMILEYNLLTTRGMPDFHDRKGGVSYVDNP